MVQQGQIFQLTRRGRDGEGLWAFRYRTGGRDSKRVQRGGFASEQDARDALERELERLRRERRISRSLTLAELVETYLADRLNPEAATVLVDVAAHFGRSGSSSLAKNTYADFKISFARRNSKFSWRNRLISSRSSLVGRSGLRPASASAWRTHFPSVSEWIPRSAATCAIGRPLSSAKRTPRSSNSSGYFLGLDMTAEDLLSPGQHPGSKDPAKPGPAQGSVLHRAGSGAASSSTLIAVTTSKVGPTTTQTRSHHVADELATVVPGHMERGVLGELSKLFR